MTLIYFGFFYKGSGKRTGYQRIVDSSPGSEIDRWKHAIFGLAGTILLSTAFSWTSIAFPAWGAKLFSAQPYEQLWLVTGVHERSGPVWSTLFELELKAPQTDEAVTLQLPRKYYEVGHWRKGQAICVIGRTGFFGTIVESVGSKECSRYYGVLR